VASTGITSSSAPRSSRTAHQASAKTSARLHRLLLRISCMVVNGPWPSVLQRNPSDSVCKASAAASASAATACARRVRERHGRPIAGTAISATNA
jgi:hypothetical protein